MELKAIVEQPFHIHLAEPEPGGLHDFKVLVTFKVASQNKHIPVTQCLNLLRKRGKDMAIEKVVCRYIEHLSCHTDLAFLAESRFLKDVSSISANQAFRLLNASDDLPEDKVVLNVPKKWQNKPPPKAKLQLDIRKEENSKFGVHALFKFDRSITLNGKKLSSDQIKELVASDSCLQKIDGQWVRADVEKLRQILSNWDYLESLSLHQGMPFGLALRILTGWQQTIEDRVVCDDEITDVDFEGALNSLLNGESKSYDSELDSYQRAMKVSLRDYQRKGVSWMLDKVNSGLGCLLCDDMGLGKTVQVLALLSLLRSQQTFQKILVVAPASLRENWRRESKRFFTEEAPQVLIGGSEPLKGEFVVTSYATLRSRADLQEVEWDIVILDEAQKIKNSDSKTYGIFKELKASCRLAMTGTPIENSMKELWSIVDYILPGLLGKKDEFLSHFEVEELSHLQQAFQKLLSPFMIRRTKMDRSIAAELPDKLEKTHYLTLGLRQRALYHDCLEDLSQTINGDKNAKLQVLPYLMKLKKICNHPAHYLDETQFDPDESQKFSRLSELARDIHSREEKFIVFTQFKTMCGPILELLQAQGLKGAIISGDTAQKKRQAIIDQFSSDRSESFLVLSLHAAGVGLNITAANHVVHFDRWWNPAVENQATDRSHRIGQKKVVTVHTFVTKGTLEDKIDAVLKEKSALAENFFLGLQTKSIFDMSLNEFKDLVSMTEEA